MNTQTQNVTQIQSQTQTQTTQKTFLVRVVVAHRWNLHLVNKETKQKLTIRDAGQYKSLLPLLDYLEKNGKHKEINTFNPIFGRHFWNDVYSAELTAEQIMSMLCINKYNAKSGTVLKIKQFLGLQLSE